MPAGFEIGGGLLRDGGRHRRTPTLQSMSSSIFLLGPFMLQNQTHREANMLDMHKHHNRLKNRVIEDREHE